MLQIFYKEKPIIISDNKTDLKNSLMIDLELLDNIDLIKLLNKKNIRSIGILSKNETSVVSAFKNKFPLINIGSGSSISIKNLSKKIAKILEYKGKIIFDKKFPDGTFKKNLNSKILGPINAPIYKIRKNFRYRILIRSKKSDKIQEPLGFILKRFKFSSGMKLTVDVDPISFN